MNTARDTQGEGPGWWGWDGDTLICRVRLQPRASRNEVAGLHAGRLRLRVTSPPVEGRANAQAAELLAKLLRVPKSNVTLSSGHHGRDKVFRVAKPVVSPRELGDALQRDTE